MQYKESEIDLESNRMYLMDEMSGSVPNGDEITQEFPEHDYRLSDSPNTRLNTQFFSDYWHSNVRKQRRSYIYLALLGGVLLYMIFFLPIWAKNTDRLSEQAIVNPERRFNIRNLYDGEFSITHESFRFIRAPPQPMKKVEDPGMYFTVNEYQKSDSEIMVGNLFDVESLNSVGNINFEYEGIRYKIQGIEISYYLDKMLVMTNKTSLFRHSKTALFWIKDLKTNTFTPLSDKLLRNAQFSPSFNYISFVDYNYNVNVFPVHAPDTSHVLQISDDGKPNSVLNGVPDWVYEEEILASDNTIWWSPNDEWVAYMKTLEDGTNTYRFPLYVETKDFIELNYPLPGKKFPEYELHVANLMTGNVFVIASYQYEEELIYDVHWIDNSNVLVKKSDRTSSRLKYILCTYDEETSHWNHNVINDMNFATTFNGWVEKQHSTLNIPVFEDHSDTLIDTGYIDIRPDESGFNHIFYAPSMKTPQVFLQLTRGNFEVQEILGYNIDKQMVYYTTNSKHAMAKHIYSVAIFGESEDSVVSLQDGNDVLEYNEFSLSPSCRWAIRKILGPGTPVVWVGALTKITTEDNMKNIDNDGFTLTDSSGLNSFYEKYDMPTINFKTMEIPVIYGKDPAESSNIEINFKEYLPPNFDPKSKKHHPILVHVYGGPGSVTFTSEFEMFFEAAAASALDAIVLEIEPRGTGNKGWDFKQFAKNNIGYWEPRDVQAVVKKYIEQNASKINTERVAIWGWSYGGFTTLKTLELDNGAIFKYGMAVAPVTNWLSYDAVYTERYLGLPGRSYENAVVSDIQNFKNVQRFLLMSGTADDNVHVSNTYELLDKLNLHEVTNFDMQMFPDSDHNILYHNANQIVYNKLFSWLENAFNGRFDKYAV